MAEQKNNVDLYSGYNDYDPYLDEKNLQFDQRFQQAVLRSSLGNRTSSTANEFNLNTRRSNGGRRNTTFNQSSLANSNSNYSNDVIRPVTAVRAAGYTKGYKTINIQDSGFYKNNTVFDPIGQSKILNYGLLQKSDDFTGMSKTKVLQLKIQELYEESVLASQKGNYIKALEKAKLCVTIERNLQKHLTNQQKHIENDTNLFINNPELYLSVQLNLAIQMAQNNFFQDALSIYNNLTKNKQLSKQFNGGRFKCNIGCIYYLEAKYQKAIKYFQMALDQLNNSQQEFKIKIMRNIAYCFIRLGKFTDAFSSFDYILSEKPSYQDAFRLLICNCALQNKSGLRTSFIKLLENRNYLYGFNSLNLIKNSSFKDAKLDNFESFDEDDDENELFENENLTKNIKEKFLFQKNEVFKNLNDFEQLNKNDESILKRIIHNDLLTNLHNGIIKQRNWSILTAVKLISNYITDDIKKSFSWCAYCIYEFFEKNQFSSDKTLNSSNNNDDLIININSFSFDNSNNLANELISEIQLACAEYYLKKREIEPAITILSVFEKSANLKRDSTSSSFVNSAKKRLWKAKCTALTNLSYIYLLQKQIEKSHKYLDQVLDLDHSNVGALINKGCCFLYEKKLDQSKEYFNEALFNEPNCLLATYNLALVNKQAGHYENCIDLLFRINQLTTNNEFSLNQIGNVYENLNNFDQALNWYEQSLSQATSDVNLLNKLSDLYNSMDNKQQALIYLMESFRLDCSNIQTLERLAAHYIELKAFEKAIFYLKHAIKIQPSKIKWFFMVAACYRHNGDYQQSFSYYKIANKRFPENFECLKFLLKLSDDLNLLSEKNKYSEKLLKLEKIKEQREKRILSGQLILDTIKNERENSASSLKSIDKYDQINKNLNNKTNYDNLSIKSFNLNEEINKNFLNEIDNQINLNKRPMTSVNKYTDEEKLENEFSTKELIDILP